MEEEIKPAEGETVVVAADEPKEDSGYKDITLTCVDCHKEFVWTAGEQAFYAEHGFHQPKRCKECREANKARIAAFRKERKDSYGYGNEQSAPATPSTTPTCDVADKVAD